jgi:hypothetical protein
MTEEWRDVAGAEGRYQVSDLGRVRSLRRGECVLKSQLNTNGYLVNYIYPSGGPRKLRSVHTLVAEAFLGPRPNGLDVRHKNDIKTDCRAGNLEYGTRSQNMKDAVKNGRLANSNKTECGVCGTDYNDVNTYVRTDGGRECRVCSARRRREYQERKLT